MKLLPLFLLIAISTTVFGQFEIELNPSGIVLPRLSKSDKATITPVEGQLFYNPESKSLMLFTGTQWISIEGTPILTDIDGNVYETIEIAGTQWMTQNLRTTKLNDGTPISVDPPSNIRKDEITLKSGTATPKMWAYDNDLANVPDYGYLYNHCAVATGNLCPTGWRVPDGADFQALVTANGGSSVAGFALKETGTTYWNHAAGTNSSGWSARGGGGYFYGVGFGALKNAAYYWSTVTSLLLNGGAGAHALVLISNNGNAGILTGETIFDVANGLSIRCVL